MNRIEGRIPLLKIFILIVDADESTGAIGLLRQYHPHILYQYRASGTATSDIMDILGFGGVEKVVTVCIVPDFLVDRLLASLLQNLSLYLHGTGVAFTIPLSGITGRAMTLLNREGHDSGFHHGHHHDHDHHHGPNRGHHHGHQFDHHLEKEVPIMKHEIEHHLIVATVNRGFSEAVVEVARHAGAKGGTVWVSRKVGIEEHMKMLGVALQSEQEIVIMLVDKEHKLEIMKAVNDKHGIASEAQGIILSLPVDSVIGLSKDKFEQV